MKGIQLALGIILVLLFPAFLHAQDRFEAFGGYSYFRASVSETGTQLCPGPPGSRAGSAPAHFDVFPPPLFQHANDLEIPDKTQSGGKFLPF
jgi:hypothetical protein